MLPASTPLQQHQHLPAHAPLHQHKQPAPHQQASAPHQQPAPPPQQQQLLQVMHAKMIALEWLRVAGAHRAHVPWWRDTDSEWRTQRRVGAVSTGNPGTRAVSPLSQKGKPARIIATSKPSFPPSFPSRVYNTTSESEQACTSCGNLTSHSVFLAHVSLPYWPLCESCTATTPL